jgi:hypothetical protein
VVQDKATSEGFLVDIAAGLTQVVYRRAVELKLKIKTVIIVKRRCMTRLPCFSKLFDR